MTWGVPPNLQGSICFFASVAALRQPAAVEREAAGVGAQPLQLSSLVTCLSAPEAYRWLSKEVCRRLGSTHSDLPACVSLLRTAGKGPHTIGCDALHMLCTNEGQFANLL